MTGVEKYTLSQRPLKIESANVSLASGASQPVRIVTTEEYSAFSDRSLTGNFAQIAYYDAAFPIATISLIPMPKVGGSLNLTVYLPLAQVALTDLVALPPGYERAVVWALSLECAPQFGAAITPELQAMAADAKSAIFGLNQAVLGPPSPIAQPMAVPA